MMPYIKCGRGGGSYVSNRVRQLCVPLWKCVEPGQNGQRVQIHEKLCFHSQFGSTSVPLNSPATAGGLLELRGCSSTYIPTSDTMTSFLRKTNHIRLKGNCQIECELAVFIVVPKWENPAKMAVGLYTWIRTISPANLPLFYVSKPH